VASRDIVSYILRVSQDMTSSQRVLVIPLKYRLRRVDLGDTLNIGCITTACEHTFHTFSNCSAVATSIKI